MITGEPPFVRVKLIDAYGVVMVSGMCIIKCIIDSISDIYMTISMGQLIVCLGIPSLSSILILLNYTIPKVQCYLQPGSLIVFTLYLYLMIKSHYERLTNGT